MTQPHMAGNAVRRKSQPRCTYKHLTAQMAMKLPGTTMLILEVVSRKVIKKVVRAKNNAEKMSGLETKRQLE
ncbi:hypothetical protein GmHk_03G007381 [Glycine max]|uniref:Uncharacterized protein n=1 Tax=Glycine max TaxID=3847 RepID=A0A0R0KQZ8_SOYBN|nr:hypothetical protein GYH30_006720 [Glycine max]KAH1257403.1 hypothetical protein GmHk_03G007381 [Glycine max]